MKASKRVMTWIVISLVLQCSVYLFLDKYYYGSAGDIKITDMTSEEQVKKIVPSVQLSSTAKNVTLSDDLAYTASIENGLVKVVDTNTGKEKANLTYSSGVKCLAYMWVPDSDIIDIVEKVNNSTIKFYSYNAENDVKTETTDSTTHKVLSVSAGQSAEMKMSVSTGVLYIKVGNYNNSSKIYRIDRNLSLTRASTSTSNVGNFAVASSDDQLIYEDLANETVRAYNYPAKRSISIAGVKRLSIIGTDDNDNFYIGNGSKQSNKIYYGKLSDNSSSWKNVQLDSMIDNKNIIVIHSGSIYIVDRQKSVVTDVKNNKVYTYQGIFLQINNGNIIYNNGGELKFKPL